MKTYVGVEVIAPPFLTSVLEWREWLATNSCRFSRSTLCVGGWVGLRARLENGHNMDWGESIIIIIIIIIITLNILNKI
jgi:hypothetical protein